MNKARDNDSSGIPGNSVWFYWMLISIAVLTVHLTSLDLYPRVTQDGAQIVELGRVFLDPSTTWAANWNVHESKPLFPIAYIGSAIQELAYVSGAPGILGPRLLALIGAVLAASIALGWMKARGTQQWVALFISVAFLLDPIFNSSYRQGRIDCLAFAAVLAACWVLRHALKRAENHEDIHRHVFFAGALLGLSPFLWLTSLALVPLVFLEFFHLAKFFWQEREESRFASMRSLCTWFIAGGAITVVLLVLPFLVNWEHYSLTLSEGTRIQKVASVIKRSIVDMYAVHDPLLVPVVLAALLVRREVGLIIAMLLALLMMTQTMIYQMRILYLLPYLVAFIASASATLSLRKDIQHRRAVLYSLLGFLIALNIGITLIRRPAIAFHQKEARLPENITHAMNQAIGAGPYNVFMQEWDVYFAGRALGWKIYNVFGRAGEGTPEFRKFLAKMDYVILRTDFLFMKVRPEVLENAGFELHTKISFPEPNDSAIELGPLSFRSSVSIYDDLLIYKKQN